MSRGIRVEGGKRVIRVKAIKGDKRLEGVKGAKSGRSQGR